MYPPLSLDGQELMLRPMTCPHHFMLYKTAPHSYRELPVRYTEIAPQYRRERSGELYGLVRVLEFHLADSHIMCRPDQVQEEFLAVLDLVQYVMATLGLAEDCSYRASLHDPLKDKFDDADWEQAERVLLETLEKAGLPYQTALGEAAFYGPKLDVQMTNIAGKEETVFTIQVDCLLPERFQMTYVDRDGQERRPVVIHRSSIGCVERTIAFLLEKFSGALPTWLSPVQVRLIPVADEGSEACRRFSDRLRRARARVEVDDREETVGKRVRDALKMKIPYTAVVGPREAQAETISVRARGSQKQATRGFEEFLDSLCGEIATRSPGLKAAG
jgi:threonyl-tRNA synthetase